MNPLNHRTEPMRPVQSSPVGGPRSRLIRGFTLIEVMVVVAILGILGAVAYPAYTEQVVRGRRVDAQTGLIEASQWMQRYYAAQNSFKDADTNFPTSLKTAPRNGTKTYNIAVTVNADNRSYSLKATPINTDSKCGYMTLDDAGIKGIEKGTVATCWR